MFYLSGASTLDQQAVQELRPFLRIWRHEKSTFERSCPTLSDLKPSIFVEKIHESLYPKAFLGKRYKSSLHH
jgi:uncharacterized protein (DUF1800 family)